MHRFFYQMVLPYLSIYTMALGATGTQLGIVNSIGMGGAAMLSPFTGWLIDRIGTKRIYLVGIGLLALSFLTYGVAQSWPIIIVAMLAYWVGFTTSMHSCGVICANSLAKEDRVTAMSCCETLAVGLMGIAGPMLGALLVTRFGGINLSSIRPLFFISFVGTMATFFLVSTQLSNRSWGGIVESGSSLSRDLSQVFRQGQSLKRFLVIHSITFLPQGMVIPFTQVFAREVKGADQFILGVMVAGFALTPFLLGIPLGRLADKIGRKKVLYLMAPLFWASNVILIWAPNSLFLLAAGILQGFININLVVTGAMNFELVPPEQMGRWVGISRFFRMLLAAVTALLAGAIWDNIGPQYLFLIVAGLDIFIRIPLLMGMPETLAVQMGKEQ
ncbi:MAG: MFS transporter [Proteobacteria bacterium]|nr:MFS transporter [Pseudomonadota bacterium]